MNRVAGLPPGGDRKYNNFLVNVEGLSRTPNFLPCHQDDTVMDKALLTWNIIFAKITSDRDTKFTSELFKNLHQVFWTKLSLYTAYHLQTDGLAERMVQMLEDMVR
ncbi:hypothetical protein O181_093202 [Austropuccinia psidii MF-1]|uniref:Integrase catalytic domain-containing protein n=1 Tax=Austropuccinia psidii MF-1 TaxID=1389203 RepID=A0A9Q3J107_9BASI|nr:hypothetical protein [Austropuccinia psidii MF-1]